MLFSTLLLRNREGSFKRIFFPLKGVLLIMILPAAKTKSGPDGGGGIGGGRGTHLDRSAPLTRLGILKLRLLSYLYRRETFKSYSTSIFFR